MPSPLPIFARADRPGAALEGGDTLSEAGRSHLGIPTPGRCPHDSGTGMVLGTSAHDGGGLSSVRVTPLGEWGRARCRHRCPHDSATVPATGAELCPGQRHPAPGRGRARFGTGAWLALRLDFWVELASITFYLCVRTDTMLLGLPVSMSRLAISRRRPDRAQ